MNRACTIWRPMDRSSSGIRAMRQQVAENNVYRWAGRLLLDAAAVRESAAAQETALG